MRRRRTASQRRFAYASARLSERNDAAARIRFARHNPLRLSVRVHVNPSEAIDGECRRRLGAVMVARARSPATGTKSSPTTSYRIHPNVHVSGSEIRFGNQRKNWISDGACPPDERHPTGGRRVVPLH
jgi:hypothetical protein